MPFPVRASRPTVAPVTDRPAVAPVSRPDGDRPSADRVLIIEDDPHIGDVLARYLALDGIEVEVVRDGLDGLARALEWLPDLVVLDLMLPRLDGFGVFSRLRAVAPVPVIMLTARGDEQDRVAGLEMGADDYVAKPFSAREVSARIRSVLRRARTTHQTSRGGDRTRAPGGRPARRRRRARGAPGRDATRPHRRASSTC